MTDNLDGLPLFDSPEWRDFVGGRIDGNELISDTYSSADEIAERIK